MHGRMQMTTQLDSLRDTAAITALSRQFVYTTMAESGQLDAIRVGSGAVRWRETESPGGHGWLPRCKCSEPAYPMCVHWESGEGALRPPSNPHRPHRRAPKSGSRESGRRRPRSILPVR